MDPFRQERHRFAYTGLDCTDLCQLQQPTFFSGLEQH